MHACVVRREGKLDLTLKSWNIQGTTSLDGAGVRGLEDDGDTGLVSALFVCTELFRVRRNGLALGGGRFESELRWEFAPSTSSPKKPASFFRYEFLFPPDLKLDSWLPTVVALATEGRRSSSRQ